jgi:cysteine desulfurase
LNSINSDGIEAEYIDVGFDGEIDTNSLIAKIKQDTPLITVMMVNNEIGTIQPIADIAKICKTEGIFFHVDAVQAFGHIPICINEYVISPLSIKDYSGITSLSISGHKIGAPKGIGALYIRKDAQQFYSPLIYGGQQESGMRGGTENVPYIVGFAKACELAKQKLECSWAVRKLSSYIWDFLNANISNIKMNGSLVTDPNHTPNILNISIKGVRGEELVAMLDDQEIYVSTGSACNSNSKEPSHVLKAIGCSDEEANSSIRISLSNDTTLKEVNEFCEKLVYDIKILRS